MPFYVYVIELDPAVTAIRRFRKRNPDMDMDGLCFYVGQSAHEPDCRYRQHKLCHGENVDFDCICGRRRKLVIKKNVSNRYARKFGKCLRANRFEKYNPMKTRAEAERMEAKLARELQAQGHGVWWG